MNVEPLTCTSWKQHHTERKGKIIWMSRTKLTKDEHHNARKSLWLRGREDVSLTKRESCPRIVNDANFGVRPTRITQTRIQLRESSWRDYDRHASKTWATNNGTGQQNNARNNTWSHPQPHLLWSKYTARCLNFEIANVCVYPKNITDKY